ncbi:MULTISPECIES: MarR family winged helix-turn-helix transcriptional regulator [unclassified Rhodosalinus]|uniref:MarR family winged helix-turn-helix transcriptional regulator n=1 Tax=unclassified Rhodosalinus TaxID=2630183 RepID=UPI0035264EE5
MLDYDRLDRQAGFLLRLAQIQIFDAYFRDFAPRSLRPGMFSALVLIDRNPGIRHGLLAAALRVKLAHMTKLLNALEAERLIERHQPPEDRRSVLFYTTPEGHAFVAKATPELYAHDDRQLDHLTARERRQFIRLLRKFVGMPPLQDD